MSSTNVASAVSNIIKQVQRQGDTALCDFAKKFDGITLKPSDLRVSSTELRRSLTQISPSFRKALQTCAQRIRTFAQAEKTRVAKSWTRQDGSILTGQIIRPVDSTGLYIPGGRFPYPSTVLMTAIPAQVAGVKRIIMASPAKNLTVEVLAAAALAGVQEVYRMGGAGAIAAMALGTKSVKPVHFIVGPGNSFVTEAKRQLFGVVGIDLLAGPSEVVVIADGTVPATLIEADLRAQAEHDPEANSLLLSTSSRLLAEVRALLGKDLLQHITLKKVRNLEEAFRVSNEIAPEHLEVLVPNARRYLGKIQHAGAIFLGPDTPAALGDYVAGPSHVLPTNRAGRFSSGLSVATFLKRSSVTSFLGKKGERASWDAALSMAETEGMEFHAASLRRRMR